MRGWDKHDDELEEFIAARTQDLHHDAYQLTAAQQPAEELVIAVLADMRRERIDMAQAGSTARLRMARACAQDDAPTEDSDVSGSARHFRPLARLSPRQRAALVLRVVEGYDDREIARGLQLTSRATTETLDSVPYDELPGATPHSDELRSLLEDFGDLATSPSASTTLADVRAAPPPPRRLWWTYAAALVVIALTITTVVVTQGWHKDWLKTPDGLNHTHGTHFPTYLQGYKLVDVRDMTPGIAQNVTTGSAGAVALPCDVVDPTVRLSVQSEASEQTEGDLCAKSAPRARLTPVKGRSSAMVLDGTRGTYPIGLYRKVPISEYPVATSDFEVQHDLTLDAVRAESTALGRQSSPESKGAVITLRGTAAHHNGTFTKELRLPRTREGLEATTIRAVGLLSPTTTGRFRVRIDGRPAMTNCGEQRPVTYYSPVDVTDCSLVDRRVPQVKYLQDTVLPQVSVSVEITVTGTRGPWTFQLAADGYAVGTGSTN